MVVGKLEVMVIIIFEFFIVEVIFVKLRDDENEVVISIVEKDDVRER